MPSADKQNTKFISQLIHFPSNLNQVAVAKTAFVIQFMYGIGPFSLKINCAICKARLEVQVQFITMKLFFPYKVELVYTAKLPINMLVMEHS